MALLQKAYLGSTPLFRNEDWFEDGTFLIANSGSATVTANSTAHTKGAWSEIIASTSANASLLIVVVQNVATSTVNTATLLDIATGSSGSETVIISNLAVGGAHNQRGLAVNVPFKIPSGTRLSARIQSVVTGGKTATIELLVMQSGDYDTAPTSVDVIGTSTATSQGTSMSGASGSWVEITASTSRAYRAVSIVPSMHDTAISSYTTLYTIGVGASGSEQQIGTARCVYGSVETVNSDAPFFSIFGQSIPAGSRLAVKHDLAGNQSRYGVCLIGIP